MVQAERDLDRIRQQLVLRRGVLAERRARVERDLSRKNDPLVADSSDQAIQLENDQTLEAIAGAARDELVEIEEALRRLQAGQYGICKGCGSAIAADRLRAIPHAVTCQECASD